MLPCITINNCKPFRNLLQGLIVYFFLRHISYCKPKFSVFSNLIGWKTWSNRIRIPGNSMTVHRVLIHINFFALFSLPPFFCFVTYTWKLWVANFQYQHHGRHFWGVRQQTSRRTNARWPSLIKKILFKKLNQLNAKFTSAKVHNGHKI